MHVEWQVVTGNPQVTRKLTEFAKMCCTSPAWSLCFGPRWWQLH